MADPRSRMVRWKDPAALAERARELGVELVPCELRLTLWPGGEERLLARGDVHLAPVEWLE